MRVESSRPGGGRRSSGPEAGPPGTSSRRGEGGRVLFLAYYFPPDGGAGPLRAAKITRYLPEFGWEPHVVAAEPEHDARDPSLEQEIRSAAVVRVRGFQPVRIWRGRRGAGAGAATAPAGGVGRRIRRLLRQALFVPDEAVYWTLSVLARASELAESIRPDVVLATQPNSVLLAATLLARRLGLPCVTDFRDEWSGGAPSDERPWIRRVLEGPLERAVVRHSSAVVCNTPGMRRGFQRRYPGLQARFALVPNGYDERDFPSGAPCRTGRAPAASPREGPLTVAYAGAFYGDYNPLAFLEACGAAVRDGSLPADELRIRFLGRHDAAVTRRMRRAAEAAGIGMLELPGHLPHAEAIGALLEADLLLLVMPEEASSGSRITAKTYEVLATGRPVLAMLPEGDARELVRLAGSAWALTGPRDVAGAAGALHRAWQAKRGGDLLVAPDWSVVRRYERRRLTGDLAGVLDRVTGD